MIDTRPVTTEILTGQIFVQVPGDSLHFEGAKRIATDKATEILGSPILLARFSKNPWGHSRAIC